MSEQNVPLQELENLIELAKSRATTPVNFENSSPQASAPPPSYFTPSKALTQQKITMLTPDKPKSLR